MDYRIQLDPNYCSIHFTLLESHHHLHLQAWGARCTSHSSLLRLHSYNAPDQRIRSAAIVLAREIFIVATFRAGVKQTFSTRKDSTQLVTVISHCTQ